MFPKPTIRVQPLEEGKAPTGSTPRGGEICLSTILPPAIGGGTGGNLEGPVMRRTVRVSRYCFLLSNICPLF